MNSPNRLRPRPLTPFIVADALGLVPVGAHMHRRDTAAPVEPVKPRLVHAEPPAARTPPPSPRRPGELVSASAPV